MRLVTLPGVFRPISDTWLLADALDREPLAPGARVLDRICDGAHRHLRPGGALLVVHSSLLGVEPTLEALAAGLEVDVPVRERGPLGPLMTARRAHLEASGLLAPGQSHEDVVVVRARTPGGRPAQRAVRKLPRARSRAE